MKIFIALILFAAIYIFIFFYQRVLRKQMFKNRGEKSFEETYASIDGQRVSYDTFISTFKALGDAYSINPQFIRPTDLLKTFFVIDSWNLDAGTEKMNEWLIKSFQIENGKFELKTVLDLLLLIEQHKNEEKSGKPL